MIANVFCTNVALMVWVAVTLLNVNVVIAPCDTPSTNTSATL